MRACGAGVEIGTKVQLRAEEEDRQENGNDANSRPFIRHVYIQEELKEEWLPGQGSWASEAPTSAARLETLTAKSASKCATLQFGSGEPNVERKGHFREVDCQAGNRAGCLHRAVLLRGWRRVPAQAQDRRRNAVPPVPVAANADADGFCSGTAHYTLLHRLVFLEARESDRGQALLAAPARPGSSLGLIISQYTGVSA